MAQLSSAERARLPDSAFAYVDSSGNRRLPINDASHVRNALARFGQVSFESEDARRRARQKLLAASKRHGIVPLGFIEAELRTERSQSAAAKVVVEASKIATVDALEAQLRTALGDESFSVLRRSADDDWLDVSGMPVQPPRAASRITILEAHGHPSIALLHGAKTLRNSDLREAVEGAVRFVVERQRIGEEMAVRHTTPKALPTGEVALLFGDLEGSTELLIELGDRYASVLGRMRRFVGQEARARGGHVVDMTGDEVFLAFSDPAQAVEAAIAIQRRMASTRWPGADVRLRIGVHHGTVTVSEGGYVGLAVNTASRVMSLSHGGQIVVTRAIRGAARDVEFRDLGTFRLKGLSEPVEAFEVRAEGLMGSFPPPRI